MTPQKLDHETLSELFYEATQLPPDERAAMLDTACRHDPAMRAEIDSLLAGFQRIPRVLQSEALVGQARRQLEAVPEKIGSFSILKKLGEGGMGIVYLAEQREPIRRLVAIKLIKRGFETSSSVARFDTERQSLALMNHPNIARVLDAGVTDDARPYIAMEHVEGQPITRYCDDQRLDIRERLKLFLQVCEGAQHAHQKSIVHRDIKPSNILVDASTGQPIAKIIDFGVAKAMERGVVGGASLTQAGQLIGTLEYMSPEQTSLNANATDTRTDIYSLGAVLYELLVGCSPLGSAGLDQMGADELRRIIREIDPPTPSARCKKSSPSGPSSGHANLSRHALAKKLRGELDWIVMRAIEKDPNRRYSSPRDLADDLQRYLDYEPVKARPASRAYLANRFVRRHRVGVAACCLLMAMLIGFATTMTVQNRRIAVARDRATAAALAATSKASAARAVSDFLVGIFNLAPDIDVARRQLDAAQAQIRRELKDRPEQQARLLYPLGQIYVNLGFEQGLPLMLTSIESLRETLGAADEEFLAMAHTGAVQLAELGRYEEGKQQLKVVVEERNRSLGPDHPDTLLATGHFARILDLEKRFDEAEPLILDTVARAQRALGERHPTTIKLHGFAATLRLHQHRLTEAEALTKDVLESMTRWYPPNHRNHLALTYQLALIKAQQGEFDSALDFLRDAVNRGWAHTWSEASEVYSAEALRTDARLAGLRGHQGFEAMVGPAGYITALDQARAAARRRELGPALAQLQLAIDRGFRNGDALLADDRLLPLQTAPEFQALIHGLAGR